MNRILIYIFVLISLLVLSCNEKKQDDTFYLEGNLSDITDDTLEVKDITSYADTTYIVVQDDGDFLFKIVPDTFKIYDVMYNGGAKSFTVFAERNTRVSVSMDKKTGIVIVDGGLDDNKLLTDFRRKLYFALDSVSPHPQDSLSGMLCVGENDSITRPRIEKMHRIAADFIRQHRTDYASTVVFRDYLWNSPKPDYALMDSVLEEMNGVLKDLPCIQKAESIIKKKMQVGEGKYVYSITMDCIGGKKIQVYDQRENYVFIDFWASWSDRSLQFRDELKNVYVKFKDKKKKEGNQVRKILFVGVSLDSDTTLCKISTLEHDIKWPQICDGEGWTSDLAVKYCVTYLPDNILLAPNNKVIGKGLTVDELEKTLEKEFNVR